MLQQNDMMFTNVSFVEDTLSTDATLFVDRTHLISFLNQITCLTVFAVTQLREQTMKVNKNKVRLNIARHKFAKYSYIVFCLLFLSYFLIYRRFNQISNLNIFKNQIRKLTLIETTSIIPPLSNLIQKTTLPMKYILLWTNARNYPYIYFGEGNSIFINKSCKWNNCYVTGNRNFLKAYTDFEVIAFDGPHLPELLQYNDFPNKRTLRQKYVYTSIESAANYPFHTNDLNSFFNWTWTYKLNSDLYWGYIVVRDANNSVIGPGQHINWINVANMDPIDDKFKLRLQSKNKAAAWMCSYCLTSGHREDYVNALQRHLIKYHLKVDIFGRCGDHQCPKEIMPRCLQLLKKRYYFYLAFENSLSDDYVTEKILYALNYDTIPIVYGGANYSRFLPEGIYLDAVKLGPEKLAETMMNIINDPDVFHRFFRWKKYYSFHPTHDSPETDTYCKICGLINNETLMNDHRTYKHFNTWWMHKVTKIL